MEAEGLCELLHGIAVLTDREGTARIAVAFGRDVCEQLGQRWTLSRHGLITDYQVLDGNPSDTLQVQPSLERHREIFPNPAELYAGDRGFFSAENEESCKQAGVVNVSIPQRGGTKTAERQALECSPAFKEGQRFRVGIEGRISVLFRGRGMKRCLAHGRERFEILVGAAVLANNLLKIGDFLKNRKPSAPLRAAA